MPDNFGASEFLSQSRFFLLSPVDLKSDDPDVVEAKVRYLTYLARYINIVAVSDFGGRAGAEREAGLTEQVVAAAFQTFGGVDPYQDHFLRAAMLLRGITQGHPFNDGNKRTGFVVAAYYLDAVGYSPPETLDADEVVEFCLAVSAGSIRDVLMMAGELRRLWGVPRSERS